MRWLRAVVFLIAIVLGPHGGTAQTPMKAVPGNLPDIKMDCAALYWTPKPDFKSPPFHLYLEVYFEEKYVLLSDEEGRTNTRMLITDIIQNVENKSKSITLSGGTVRAIINMHHKDIMILQRTPVGVIEWGIGGRQCRIDPLS